MQFQAAAPPSVRTLPPGLVLGRYVIVDRIGAGGMAELYLARVNGPPRFSKAVALKLLHPHLGADPEFVRMFDKEARIAATLDHPNVVQVLDVGHDSCGHFLVLEYVHGCDLRRLLSAGGPVPLGAAVRVIVDVARALHHAHNKSDVEGRPMGLVHRDVSPANVLVSYQGVVKLTDFGIAKMAEQTALTSTTTLKGKFGYMAPEQFLQETVDAKTDVFALGVVLYEVTTGKRAFASPIEAAIMNKVLAGSYVPPSDIVSGYPPELTSIVARTLAVEARDRYPSAAALADALEAFAERAGLDARASGLAAHMRSLFGDPPPPSLDVVATPTAQARTSARPVGESTMRRRTRSTLQRALAVAALVAVAFVAGSMVGSGAPAESALVAPETAPTAHALAAEVTAPAVVPAATAPQETPQPAATPGPNATAIEPPVGRAPRPEPAPKKPSAKPKPGCQPPYVLNPDGSKKFKPECF